MADTSFEKELNSVTDKLVDITIGEAIDLSRNHWKEVLLIIKERKDKKQTCDIETLRRHCQERYEEMDDLSFNTAIHKLIDMNCIKELTRSGKTTFSLLSPDAPAFEPSQLRPGDDFLEFKKYVTDTFGILNRKLEKFESSLEIKDVVIKLLREELKNTQETLKSVLQQNSELVKCVSKPTALSNISSQNGTDKSAHQKEINEIINDIPLDNSLLSSYNDPLQNMNLNDQLSQVR